MRNVLERPLQLARVQVEAVSCLPAVAWERGSNLLAVPVVAGSGTELAVAIIDPESRQELARSKLPNAGRPCTIINLQWAPPSCTPDLLAITSQGHAHLITQTPPSQLQSCGPVLDRWSASPAFSLTAPPVVIKVLEAPTPWRFPREVPHPLPTPLGQTLESRFGPVHKASGQLHWLRPSLLCAVAVTVKNTLEVWWRSSHADASWLSHTPLTVELAGRVVHADITTCTDGSLQALIVSDTQPTGVSIFRVASDPAAVYFAGTHVQQQGSFSSNQPGSFVRAAIFEAASAGIAIFTAEQPAGRHTLSICKHELEPSTGTWSCTASHTLFPSQQRQDSTTNEVQVSLYTGAGANVVICRVTWGVNPSRDPDRSPTGNPRENPGVDPSGDPAAECSWSVHVLDCSSLQPVSNGMALATLSGCSCSAPAIAFSPSAACFASFHTGDACQAPCVTLAATFAAAPGADCSSHMSYLALRLMWIQATACSCWDASCAARCLTADPLAKVPEERQALTQVLRLLDQAVHAQAGPTRSRALLRLTHLKLAALRAEDGPSSRAVLTDCWARCLLAYADLYGRLLYSDEHAYLRTASKQKQFTEGAAVQAEGWATWLAKYVSLLLYCMGQYTSAQAAGDTAHVQHLPCIRLLVDPHFMSKLLQTMRVYEAFLVASVSEAGNAVCERLKKASALASQAFKLVMEQGSAFDGKQPPEVSFPALEATACSFTGPVHAASMLAVTLKGEAVAPLMASPHHAAICQPLDGMDPTSVPSALSHLHLLPTVQHVPCQDLRPSTALPAISPMPGVAAPKSASQWQRKRWRIARDVALGLMPLPSLEQVQMDILTGQRLPWSRPSAHCDLTGHTVTAALAEAASPEAAATLRTVKRAMAHACPVTYRPWKLCRAF